MEVHAITTVIQIKSFSDNGDVQNNMNNMLLHWRSTAACLGLLHYVNDIDNEAQQVHKTFKKHFIEQRIAKVLTEQVMRDVEIQAFIDNDSFIKQSNNEHNPAANDPYAFVESKHGSNVHCMYI